MLSGLSEETNIILHNFWRTTISVGFLIHANLLWVGAMTDLPSRCVDLVPRLALSVCSVSGTSTHPRLRPSDHFPPSPLDLWSLGMSLDQGLGFDSQDFWVGWDEGRIWGWGLRHNEL